MSGLPKAVDVNTAIRVGGEEEVLIAVWGEVEAHRGHREVRDGGELDEDVADRGEELDPPSDVGQNNC